MRTYKIACVICIVSIFILFSKFSLAADVAKIGVIDFQKVWKLPLPEKPSKLNSR